MLGHCFNKLQTECVINKKSFPIQKRKLIKYSSHQNDAIFKETKIDLGNTIDKIKFHFWK